MSEDKSQVDGANEEQHEDDDEPDVEAHRMKARRLAGSPTEDAAEPGMRAKRPTGH